MLTAHYRSAVCFSAPLGFESHRATAMYRKVNILQTLFRSGSVWIIDAVPLQSGVSIELVTNVLERWPL